MDTETTKYKIGKYTPRTKTGLLSAQRINYGNLHHGKIIVYDIQCKAIAKRIIKCLNKQ